MKIGALPIGREAPSVARIGSPNRHVMHGGMSPGRGTGHNRGSMATSNGKERAMANPLEPITPEFQRGWDAALRAARDWHLSQAKQALIAARRSRFPKTIEREAEVH